MSLVNNALRRWFWCPAAILLVALGQLAVWAADREPPFALISTDPIIAKRGEEVTLHANVRRDIARRCSAKYSRYVFDADGFRRDLEGERTASAEFIDKMERISPGKLQVVIKLSQALPLGSSALVTDLRYRCNPLHVLWPIFVKTEIPFEVVP